MSIPSKDKGGIEKMKKLLLLVMVIGFLGGGCATVPPGFDRIGGYNDGQFAPDRNEGFIKLNTPESDNFNPRVGSDPFCVGWVKKCEWHCMDRESW